MARSLLFDTDVLIDYLRGRSAAVEYLELLPVVPAVSAITIAELYAGVREGMERDALDGLTDTLSVIDVSQEIARLGGLIRRDYFNSHGVGINDAMIAATAEVENRSLVALNRKHFPTLADVIIPYRKS